MRLPINMRIAPWANKFVIFLLIVGLILPAFALAQNQIVKIPETMEEKKEWLEKLPQIIRNFWKEEVLPIWQKMWTWFKENVWLRIGTLFRKEIEKKKSLIEDEFKKEKEELKEEIPKVGKSLWQKIKELIK